MNSIGQPGAGFWEMISLDLSEGKSNRNLENQWTPFSKGTRTYYTLFYVQINIYIYNYFHVLKYRIYFHYMFFWCLSPHFTTSHPPTFVKPKKKNKNHTKATTHSQTQKKKWKILPCRSSSCEKPAHPVVQKNLSHPTVVRGTLGGSNEVLVGKSWHQISVNYWDCHLLGNRSESLGQMGRWHEPTTLMGVGLDGVDDLLGIFQGHVFFSRLPSL